MENEWIRYMNPELWILAAVLVALGQMLKRAALVPNKKIPLLLGVVGIFLALVWSVAETRPDSASAWLSALFSGVAQGVLCAAAAVYGHQLIKQNGKKE